MSATRATFDWRRIHLDLDRRLAQLGSTYQDDAGRVQTLLRERTARLAMAPVAYGAHTQARLLVFRLGVERYGLALDRAHEIIRMSRIAPLPGSAAPVIGIIGWRGDFVTVFDTARLIGLKPVEDGADYAIVLRGNEPRLAIAVDGLDGMIRLDASELQPPDQLPSQRRELFKGLTRDAVLVLEDHRFLARLNEELHAA